MPQLAVDYNAKRAVSQVHRCELQHGVSLTSIQTRKFKSSYWALRLITPLTEETAAMNALLPRVLRRGTARCPDQEQLAAALDELYGGVIEPSVTKRGEMHCCGFVATFLDDGLTPDGMPLLEKAAQLMGDLLLRPATRNGWLMTEYVEGEQQNLIDEIVGAMNDKRQYARQRLTELMCEGEAYGIDRLGSLESVQTINVTKLNRYYREVLATARIEAYYCGSAPAEQVEQAWREALMDLPKSRQREEAHTDWRHVLQEVRVFEERLDVKQGKMVMGWRTNCCMNQAGYPALVIANALFGGTANSKLFLNVREKLSLCYYASSMLDKHKGLMLVQSGMKFEDFERAEQEILHQLECVQKGDFTAQDLSAAKRAMSGIFRAVRDSQGQQEDYWLSQAVSEIKIQPQELAESLEFVTREQVMEAASRCTLDAVYYLKGKENAEGEETQE